MPKFPDIAKYGGCNFSLAVKSNAHFSCIARNLAPELPSFSNVRLPVNINYTLLLFVIFRYFKKVSIVILALPTGKARGCDRIFLNIVQSNVDMICPYLVNIFNTAYRSGKYLDLLTKSQNYASL